MNNVRAISNLSEQELEMGIFGGLSSGSWHDKYRDSAWVYLGGFSYELSEGDLLCVMSQWGEVEDINLVREKDTNKSKGFAFIKYEDQRSTILAVDNFNGIKLLGRVLRCDHVDQYRLPKEIREKEEQALEEAKDDIDYREQVRIGPGHAYKGKELATEHDINRGVDVWNPSTKPPAISASSTGETRNDREESSDSNDSDTKRRRRERRKVRKAEKEQRREDRRKAKEEKKLQQERLGTAGSIKRVRDGRSKDKRKYNESDDEHNADVAYELRKRRDRNERYGESSNSQMTGGREQNDRSRAPDVDGGSLFLPQSAALPSWRGKRDPSLRTGNAVPSKNTPGGTSISQQTGTVPNGIGGYGRVR